VPEPKWWSTASFGHAARLPANINMTKEIANGFMQRENLSSFIGITPRHSNLMFECDRKGMHNLLNEEKRRFSTEIKTAPQYTRILGLQTAARSLHPRPFSANPWSNY
jgi:hypothetical protein